MHEPSDGACRATRVLRIQASPATYVRLLIVIFPRGIQLCIIVVVVITTIIVFLFSFLLLLLLLPVSLVLLIDCGLTARIVDTGDGSCSIACLFFFLFLCSRYGEIRELTPRPTSDGRSPCRARAMNPRRRASRRRAVLAAIAPASARSAGASLRG